MARVGHAGAGIGLAGDIHFASDAVHVLAAAAWLGALPALAVLIAWARRHRKPQLAVRAAQQFSWLGVVCVAALLASGIVNSWNLLSGPRDLVATGSGRLVMVKVVLFAAMVGIAAVNKFRLTPRLPRAAGALQRNTLIETGLGLAVLLAVGALGTIPPTAHVHLTPADVPAEAAFVHIHGTEAMADLTVEPGRVGQANATIRVSREDSSQFPAADVRLAADPPGPGGYQINRNAVREPDGTWRIERLDFGQPGNWTVQIIVGQKDKEPIVLDGPIVIGP
jgi:hypothetical protein